MDESIKLLREIGAQQIHNDTHISKDYAQAIIHETFDDLQYVQFIGFVSILEREYRVDLGVLRAKGKEYFKDKDQMPLDSKMVFVLPSKQKTGSRFYKWLAILIVLSSAYYSFMYLDVAQSEPNEVDNTKIEDAQKKIDTSSIQSNAFKEEITKKEEIKKDAVVLHTDEKVQEPTILENNENNENNKSTENNESAKSVIQEEKVIASVVQEMKEEEVKEKRSLKILPTRRLWAGYINIKTKEKFQSVYSEEFTIDPHDDWLLLFGAGTVYLEINGEKKRFSSKQNLRFKYKDGKFSKISVQEFKDLNKGRKW
ncbi:hypothetical protein JHD48_00375 [Sulfurimonas sp. SAG-AH-194-I05]|nr:hypothetical protein [Sulfurimonas sp. SAG-AH-194-I05]MDF1874181.1 hypothetical protein [Sulfurimonas sp. SAG-AH-194-I05]